MYDEAAGEGGLTWLEFEAKMKEIEAAHEGLTFDDAAWADLRAGWEDADIDASGYVTAAELEAALEH